MAEDFTRYSLGEGVNLHVKSTPQFKTTVIYVYLHTPLAAATVTANALLPMLLARASAAYPTTAALSRHLDELYGTSFGIDVTRRGEVQSILFRMEVPGEQHIPGAEGLLRQGMETLAGIILRPATEGAGFKADYFRQESANLKQTIEGLINDKRRWAMVRCTEEMCKGEPFALYRYGRVEDLPSITPEGLLQYHQELLSRAPADIFVIGNVEPEAIRELVQQTLRLPSAPAGGRPMPVTRVKPEPGRPVHQVEERLDVNQGVLVMGLRSAVTVRDEGYFPLLVANGVLGGFPHSKLFQEVREKHSLAYFAYSGVETVKGIAFMTAGIEFANMETCKEIMLEQLKALQTGQISQEELETTVESLVNDVLGAADSPGAMADLAVDRVFSGRELTIEDRVRAYRSVTQEQVAQAAAGLSLDTIYFLNGKEGGGAQ